MVGPRTRFWIDFASTLFRHTKGSRWLAVDEIHNFAPKGKVFDADAGKALHWANRLASEGLGKGLQMLFASQRPQKVHNDTLTSAETLIAMRVLHPSDRGAVSDWIKGCGDSEGSEVLSSLAQMERGEGWVWSPEIGFGPKRVKFPMFKTYDSFRAQSVEDVKKITGWAEVDLAEIRSKFEAALQRAKADDPKELRKQIASLTAELKKANTFQSTQRPPEPPKIIETPILTGADRGLLVAYREMAIKTWEASEMYRLQSVLVKEAIDRVLAQSKGVKHTLTKPSNPAPVQHKSYVSTIRTDSDVVGAERKILTVLAQYPDGKDKVALAHISGYTVNGHFNNLLGSLRSKGFAQPGNPVRITDEGLKALGDFTPLPTGRELQEYWMNKVPNAETRILRPLLEAYPRGLMKEDLASAAGYTVNGHFNNLLGHLRTIGIVQRGNPIKASDTLFE